MNTTNDRQPAELRASLLSLVHGCPGGECLVTDCPLFWARGLWPTQRLRWFNTLGRDALLALATYRHVCGKTNRSLADAGTPAWPGTNQGPIC